LRARGQKLDEGGEGKTRGRDGNEVRNRDLIKNKNIEVHLIRREVALPFPLQ